MNGIRLVTKDLYWGMDEYYTDAWECPECHKKNIDTSTVYCGHCGIKVKHTQIVKAR